MLAWAESTTPAWPTNVAKRPGAPTASGSVIAEADTAPAEPSAMGVCVGSCADPYARAADGRPPGSAGQGLHVMPTTSPSHDLSVERAAPGRAAQPSAAAAAGSGTRAPPFSKHEKVPLAKVLCTGEVAAGVVVSCGPMTRRQQDARANRDAVWVLVVAEMFHSADRFTVPDECADAELDPILHPHVRTGTYLNAKWSEVRCPPHASSDRY